MCIASLHRCVSFRFAAPRKRFATHRRVSKSDLRRSSSRSLPDFRLSSLNKKNTTQPSFTTKSRLLTWRLEEPLRPKTLPSSQTFVKHVASWKQRPDSEWCPSGTSWIRRIFRRSTSTSSRRSSDSCCRRSSCSRCRSPCWLCRCNGRPVHYRTGNARCCRRT